MAPHPHRPSTSDLDRLVSERASTQHGVISRSQLIDLGLSATAIRGRVMRGFLRRIHPGVYSVGHSALSRSGSCLAAVLATAPGSAISHLTAATFWNISRFDSADAHVLVPRSHRPLNGVVVHRTRDLPRFHMTSRDGIPYTTATRTIVDLASLLTPWQLANVLNEAQFRRRLRLDDVRRYGRALPRAHQGTLRRAIELRADGSAGTKSHAEDAYLAAVLAAGLPTPLVNVDVPFGSDLYELDFHWPSLRLNVEIDGSGHGNPNRAVKDRHRDPVITGAGWIVLRLDPGLVLEYPDVALRRTGAAMEQARQR